MSPSAPAVGRHVLHVAVGVLFAGVFLSGCGGDKPTLPSAGGADRTATSLAPAPDAKPLPRSEPTTIRISRIGVRAPVSQLGLRPDGSIEEPPLSRPNLAGWYKRGPSPGELGPSVILGHVDANKQAAVFFRLKELRPGDRIEVTRKDGSDLVFAVQYLERVPKASFPGRKVYAEDIDYAGLRLVTCGGAFDQRIRHYVDNVIVYARLVTA